MVKVIVFFLVLVISLYSKELKESDIYINDCVSCHKKLPVTIDKYFYRYLLKYSSKRSVTKAMFDYIKNPNEKNSIMPKAFIKRFGIKKMTKLSDSELEKALDVYWERYKVFGKLK